jgi:hypothetical protein
LEAAQISGFEDKEVLKTKIFEKIKQKYQLDEEMLNELKGIFNDLEIIETEDTLLDKRTDVFIEVLRSIVSKNPNLCNSTDYDLKSSMFLSKQELKRYEKELEMKSGHYNILASIEQSEDFSMKNSLNFQNHNFTEILSGSNQKLKTSKNELFSDNSNNNFGKKLLFNDSKNELTIEQNSHNDLMMEEHSQTVQIQPFPKHKETNTSMKKLKLSERFVLSNDRVESCKRSIFDNYSQMAKTHEQMINETKKWMSNIYKSKVLNDLYVRRHLI